MTFMKLLCKLSVRANIKAFSSAECFVTVFNGIIGDLEDDVLLKYGCWNVAQISPEKDEKGYPYLEVLLEETCFKTICTLDSEEKTEEEESKDENKA